MELQQTLEMALRMEQFKNWTPFTVACLCDKLLPAQSSVVMSATGPPPIAPSVIYFCWNHAWPSRTAKTGSKRLKGPSLVWDFFFLWLPLLLKSLPLWWTEYGSLKLFDLFGVVDRHHYVSEVMKVTACDKSSCLPSRRTKRSLADWGTSFHLK